MLWGIDRCLSVTALRRGVVGNRACAVSDPFAATDHRLPVSLRAERTFSPTYDRLANTTVDGPSAIQIAQVSVPSLAELTALNDRVAAAPFISGSTSQVILRRY